MWIEKVHSGATVTLSQQGTCGGIFCVKVTLFIGECHFIQMPRLKKKEKSSVLRAHLCKLKAPCRIISTPLHSTHFDLTNARPFSSPPPRCINQIPCSTSVCVILSPEGKPCRPDLHQSMLVLPHPSTPSTEHPDRMKQTVGSLPSFTCSFFFLFSPSGGFS